MSDNSPTEVKIEPGLEDKSDDSDQPPLPPEQPPRTPSPPPSEKKSNLIVEGLDISHDRDVSQTSGSPPSKRRKTSNDSPTELEDDPNGFVIKSEPGVTQVVGGITKGEYESLEEGELDESEGEFALRKSITPVMAMDDDDALDNPPEILDPEEEAPDSPPHEIISFVGETIDKNARPNAGFGPDTEFEIIDDLGSDGEKGDDDGGLDDGSGGYLYDEDDFSMDEDEIDAMLDGGMAQYQKEKGVGGMHQDDGGNAPLEKEKVVLRERGHDPFDILPEGWVVVTHNSGMPVYLHKQTRVCTLSRPYFLGPGSARKHEIPLSAVPCLSYRRAMEKEKTEVDNPESSNSSENIPQLNGDISDNAAESAQSETSQTEDQLGKEKEVPSVKIESAEQHKKENNLTPTEVHEYCQNLFEFKTITVKRFKTWKDRRKHNTALKKASRPLLPSATKLITCPIASEKEDSKASRKKEFVLNPTGKSHVCILHEYVQHSMRVQPKYIFKEIENGNTPYSATVVIDEIQYGTGFASSKKAAKIEAARKTLEVLIPEMSKVTEEDKKPNIIDDLAYFDEVKIEDPRVAELFVKAGQPSPFQILYECLKRNYGIGDQQVEMDMTALKHQRSEFRMKVGKHEAKVPCKNKREGKQKAAQAVLQMMHPHVHTWGSLLRLYGRASAKSNEKKELVMSVAWEGEITIDMTSPVWDLKRDRAHVVNITRCVEVIDVKPYDTLVAKSEPMETDAGDVGDGEEGVSMVMEEVAPVCLRTCLIPRNEAGEGRWQEYYKDIPREVIEYDEEQYTRLLHAAIQTDTPLGICLTVGDMSHMATQTEWEGVNLFHKAVQVPEKAYSAEEGEQEFKKPTSTASNVKMATSYTSTSSGQRKQMVLVNKPDGGVTYVPLAPKTHEPAAKADDKKDEDESSARLTNSPLQGTSNVYFASGAIKPFTPPATDEKDGFIGPLYKEGEEQSEDQSLRFVPRNVGQKKEEDKPAATHTTTFNRASTSHATSYSTPSVMSTVPGTAELLSSSYLARQVSPSRPQLGASQQALYMAAAAQRPQYMMAGAQLGMSGAGLMGSMPAALAAAARPQLGLQGMAGVTPGMTPGMDQLAAYQTAAAAQAAQAAQAQAAAYGGVYYQQQAAMPGVQQHVMLQQGLQQSALQQQPQPQPMYIYDPTTGQVVLHQM